MVLARLQRSTTTYRNATQLQQHDEDKICDDRLVQRLHPQLVEEILKKAAHVLAVCAFIRRRELVEACEVEEVQRHLVGGGGGAGGVGGDGPLDRRKEAMKKAGSVSITGLSFKNTWASSVWFSARADAFSVVFNESVAMGGPRRSS